ncbi:unnamed protein product [Ambrosiozyma monospora]|uniref:Unnamed protein product n=1 Tax=Ambrosiozyma monospora TaxID=43982 RepID=A0ACB5U861_AMBMO|nr:unnamed protein product [Ambrosiozyma monospora]
MRKMGQTKKRQSLKQGQKMKQLKMKLEQKMKQLRMKQWWKNKQLNQLENFTKTTQVESIFQVSKRDTSLSSSNGTSTLFTTFRTSEEEETGSEEVAEEELIGAEEEAELEAAEEEGVQVIAVPVGVVAKEHNPNGSSKYLPKVSHKPTAQPKQSKA